MLKGIVPHFGETSERFARERLNLCLGSTASKSHFRVFGCRDCFATGHSTRRKGCVHKKMNVSVYRVSLKITRDEDRRFANKICRVVAIFSCYSWNVIAIYYKIIN